MKHIAILFFAALILASCSSEPAPFLADTTQAQEQGRADAQALCDANFTSDRDLHSALLAVKAREWQLRTDGDSLQSAAYIDAFRTTLTEANPTLASQLF